MKWRYVQTACTVNYWLPWKWKHLCDYVMTPKCIISWLLQTCTTIRPFCRERRPISERTPHLLAEITAVVSRHTVLQHVDKQPSASWLISEMLWKNVAFKHTPCHYGLHFRRKVPIVRDTTIESISWEERFWDWPNSLWPFFTPCLLFLCDVQSSVIWSFRSRLHFCPFLTVFFNLTQRRISISAGGCISDAANAKWAVPASHLLHLCK